MPEIRKSLALCNERLSPFGSTSSPTIEHELVPLFKVIGSGSHAGLKISFVGAMCMGKSGTVVAHECGNNTLDGRTELHIELKFLRFGIENGFALEVSVFADENTSAALSTSLAIGSGFG